MPDNRVVNWQLNAGKCWFGLGICSMPYRAVNRILSGILGNRNQSGALLTRAQGGTLLCVVFVYGESCLSNFCYICNLYNWTGPKVCAADGF